MGAPNAVDGMMLLDACTVINLYATRRMEEILQAAPTTVGVVDAVIREARHVRRGGTGADADEREAIDLAQLLAVGLLRTVTPTAAELDDYVQLTVQLDDGEAMTLAVALARGWEIATDEKKAIVIVADRVPVRSSLDLVNAWADAHAINRTDLGRILVDLRQRGRYVPSERHPLWGWWDAALRNA